jgi:hypothetical protein
MTDRPSERQAPSAVIPVVYRSRGSVLENEAGWTLGPSALIRAEAEAAAQRLPYRDIVELRLSYDPTRFDTQRFRCDLSLAGGIRAKVLSTSYISIGKFEDRGASYAPFVRELVTRVAQASPDCRFRAGKRPWAYWSQHAFLLAMLLLLAAVLTVYLGALPLPIVVALKLGIVAAYIPIAMLYAKRNWPRGFAPDRIPPEVLP